VHLPLFVDKVRGSPLSGMGWLVTRPARFTTSDLKRAVTAMRQAGCSVTGAKIEPDGSILVLTDVARAANDRRNPLDRLHG
jgi:hypothetical protein